VLQHFVCFCACLSSWEILRWACNSDLQPNAEFMLCSLLSSAKHCHQLNCLELAEAIASFSTSMAPIVLHLALLQLPWFRTGEPSIVRINEKNVQDTVGIAA